MKLCLGSLGVALAATLGGQAGADQILRYQPGEPINPVDVARILEVPPTGASANLAAARRINMRNLVVRPSQPVTASEASGPAPRSDRQESGDSPGAAGPTQADRPAREEPDALAVPVQFAFDSAIILPQARPQLDAVAQGIKMLPPDRTVIIEGHTDAAGREGYNLQLSVRRAAAVKRYLAEVHQIREEQLEIRGVGSRQPIVSGQPYAAENRRVQFRGG